jgi:hypothetical protein
MGLAFGHHRFLPCFFGKQRACFGTITHFRASYGDFRISIMGRSLRLKCPHVLTRRQFFDMFFPIEVIWAGWLAASLNKQLKSPEGTRPLGRFFYAGYT